MEVKKVMIAGGGTLGSQIAWQTAFKGFEVRVYDAFDAGLEKAKAFHKSYAELFASRGASMADLEATFGRLSYTTDLKQAVDGVDLVSESVPEDIKIKTAFYTELAKVAGPKTIFTSNSSTTVPSTYMEATGRPKQFLALHFANGIWDQNIAEIMGSPKTDPAIFEQVVAFSEAIGMVPIRIHKEQNGYVLNSLLVPLLMAATDLFMNGVAQPEDIDKTWQISTKTQMGPFVIMDLIGMQTMHNVAALWADKLQDPQMAKRAAFFQTYIDKGEGFYKKA